MGFGQTAQQQLTAAVDDGQQIVEVVCDAAGKARHVCQPLRVPELRLNRDHLGLQPFGTRALVARRKDPANRPRQSVDTRPRKAVRDSVS